MFREEYGQVVATLVRVFGDITVAEDAVQDAFEVAHKRWPSDGIPAKPTNRSKPRAKPPKIIA